MLFLATARGQARHKCKRRCDIYSTHLKRQGFQRLYTLEGGVQRYLATQGPQGWNGSLFVFDDRMFISGGSGGGCTAIQAGLLTLNTGLKGLQLSAGAHSACPPSHRPCKICSLHSRPGSEPACCGAGACSPPTLACSSCSCQVLHILHLPPSHRP